MTMHRRRGRNAYAGAGGGGGGVTPAPNLLTNTANLAHGDWTLQRLAAMTNALSDGEGGSDAWLLVDDNSGGSNTTRIRHAATTINTSTPHVLSMKVKPVGLDWILLAWSAGSIVAVQYFDVTNGVPGVVQNDIDSAVMTALANGFYLCEARFTSHVSDTIGLVDIRGASADENGTIPLDGTSSLNIYHPKLEEGLVATPWIAHVGD